MYVEVGSKLLPQHTHTQVRVCTYIHVLNEEEFIRSRNVPKIRSHPAFLPARGRGLMHVGPCTLASRRGNVSGFGIASKGGGPTCARCHALTLLCFFFFFFLLSCRRLRVYSFCDGVGGWKTFPCLLARLCVCAHVVFFFFFFSGGEMLRGKPLRRNFCSATDPVKSLALSI